MYKPLGRLLIFTFHSLPNISNILFSLLIDLISSILVITKHGVFTLAESDSQSY